MRAETAQAFVAQTGNCFDRSLLLSQTSFQLAGGLHIIIDGRVAGHLGAADGLKTLSIHMCVCPHFGI